MAKLATATLALQVTVDLNGYDVRALEGQLNTALEHVMDSGLITGETAMVVDDLSWHVLMGDVYEGSRDKES